MNFDINVLKRKMLVKYPFFGSVIANIDYKENNDIPTAGTNGETIYYNPVFLENLSIDEQLFVFAHEVCHIAFNHILRSKDKNQRIWNIATDAVINQFLQKDGLKIVEGGIDIKEAINYDSEQLYEILMQDENADQDEDSNSEIGESCEDSSSGQESSDDENKKSENSNTSNGQSGNNNNEQDDSSKGSSDDQNQEGKPSNENDEKENLENDSSKTVDQDDQNEVGHDSHSLWKEAVKKHEEENKKDGQQDSNDKEKDENTLENAPEDGEVQDKKDKEDNKELSEKEAFRKNAENKKQQLEDLKKNLYERVKEAGDKTNDETLLVENIGTSKSLIDWRYILKEATQYNVDWSYKNATIEDGVVVPHLEEYSTPETEIVLDTSGSVDIELLKNFLRECKNILTTSKLKVGCFDTKFYGFNEIRTESDIENMCFEGGGGTNFDVAVRAFTRRAENKIIFTDGYASMPDMVVDAIWVVYGCDNIKPKGGKVIMISEEQLEKMQNFIKGAKVKVKTY